MGRTRAVVAAIAVLVCAHAAGARATPAGVVVVPARHGPVAADELARAMARALGGEGAAVTDALAAARAAWTEGAVPAARLRAFTRVGQLANEGWRAYLAVDSELAAARLAAARTEAEELLVLDGGLEVYAELALRHGVVLGALGRAGEAEALLRLAYALDPGRAPSASEFSPDALAAYQAASATTPAARAVELSAPAGARIAIDGVVASEREVALTEGLHVIVARAPGRLARAQVVSLEHAAGGAAAARFMVELDDDPAAILDERAPLAAGVGAARAEAAVEAALLFAEVDALYLVASVYRGGRPALLGQRCVEARPRCTGVVEVGYADAAGLDGALRLLADRLAGARLQVAVTLPADARLDGGRAPGGGVAGRRRWIAVGVGVAAVAAIVTAAVLASGDDPLPTVTVDPGDFGL